MKWRSKVALFLDLVTTHSLRKMMARVWKVGVSSRVLATMIQMQTTSLFLNAYCLLVLVISRVLQSLEKAWFPVAWMSLLAILTPMRRQMTEAVNIRAAWVAQTQRLVTMILMQFTTMEPVNTQVVQSSVVPMQMRVISMAMPLLTMVPAILLLVSVAWIQPRTTLIRPRPLMTGLA